MNDFAAAMYGLPPELVVTADGPIRIVTLNRPDELNGAISASRRKNPQKPPVLGDLASARRK